MVTYRSSARVRSLFTHHPWHMCQETIYVYSGVLSLPNWRTQAMLGGDWATDRQRVEAVIHRTVRSGLYAVRASWQQPNLLMTRMTICSSRVCWTRITFMILHALLPDRRPKLGYELRPRSHDRELAAKLSCLTESKFLIKQLCTNTVTNNATISFHHTIIMQ